MTTASGAEHHLLHQNLDVTTGCIHYISVSLVLDNTVSEPFVHVQGRSN